MAMILQCPNGHRFESHDAALADDARCPTCGTSFAEPKVVVDAAGSSAAEGSLDPTSVHIVEKEFPRKLTAKDILASKPLLSQPPRIPPRDGEYDAHVYDEYNRQRDREQQKYRLIVVRVFATIFVLIAVASLVAVAGVVYLVFEFFTGSHHRAGGW